MNRFVQLHFLTSYPPSNLNRDDLGRPKTALMGGTNRLRISSQSLKRAWRTSDVFKEAISENIGTRTSEIGRTIYTKLIAGNIPEKSAKSWAKLIAEVFGSIKKPKDEELKKDPLMELDIDQLVHFSPDEMTALDKLIAKILKAKTEPVDEDLQILRKESSASDIAMFGRMLTGPGNKLAHLSVEAAVQVAHAVTVHKVAIEDDYFTAVDDLNKIGAGHIGDVEFGAGLFYLYICINRELLLKNLNNDKSLADKTIAALVEAVATISPTGKQNSFASRARAMYGLAEKGNEQPRSLHVAFLKAISGENVLPQATESMTKLYENFDKVYGNCATGGRITFNVAKGEGSIKDFIKFCIEN